jgi:hypothetical protein
VSVPDRGGILLGGVGRAADGTNSSGFTPNGSSRGRSVFNTSASSHVDIIDFNELDPFLRERNKAQQVRIDPVKEKRERESRAAKAHEKLAVRAQENGKTDLAKWYRQKAREYAAKTKSAGRPWVWLKVPGFDRTSALRQGLRFWGAFYSSLCGLLHSAAPLRAGLRRLAC